MADKKFPLTLIIKAIDRASPTLNALATRMANLPVVARRLSSNPAGAGIPDFKDFRAPESRLGSLMRVRGELGRITGEFGRFGRSIGDVFSKLGALTKRVAGYTTAAGLAIGFAAHAATEEGDALGNTAKRVGLSVDAYRQLQFVAEKVGIDVESYAGSIDQFNKRLGEAKLGKGPLTAFLQTASTSLLQQLKHTKTTEQGLDLMFKAMDRVTDSGKRAALAASAFGKSGLVMGMMVSEGTAGIARMRGEFFKSAGSYENFVTVTQDMNDAFDNLKPAAEGARNALVVGLFPALIKVVKMFTAWLVENQAAIATWAKEFGAKLMVMVDKLPAAINNAVASFRELSKTLGVLAIPFGGIIKMISTLGILLVAGPLISSIYAVGAACFALEAALLATPVGWFIAGILAIAAISAAIYESWEPIKKFFVNLWGGIRTAFSNFLDWVTGTFTRAFTAAVEVITGLFDSAKSMAGSLFDDVTKLGASGSSPGEIGWMPPQVNPERARPTESVTRNDAHVEVTVKAPPGTEVKPVGVRPSPWLKLNVGRIPELAR